MNIKLITIIISFFLIIFISLPNFTNINGKKINLGLDIQGGLFLTLGLNKTELKKNYLEIIKNNITFYSNKNNITINKITIKENYLILEFIDKDDLKIIDNILKEKFEYIKPTQLNNSITITFDDKKIDNFYSFNTEKIISVLKNRLDQHGLSEPSILKKGNDEIVIELAGINNLREEQEIKELITKVAKLELFPVEEDVMKIISSKYNNNSLSSNKKEELLQELNYYQELGYKLLHHIESEEIGLILTPNPLIDGGMLKDANVGFDNTNKPNIIFSLDSIGTEKFADFTNKNRGKRIAIVLDNKIYSTPVIKERIGGGEVSITGDFSIKEATNLSIALKSGSLPTTIELLEQRKIGPTLGSDNIKYSIYSLISGFICVILFMLIYYGINGLVANFALIFNLITILAIMSLFEATLTIPGMAGIILTVGMAVDANIIINERIREELNDLKSNIEESIKKGYDNAFSAIFDANLTTFLAAIVLFNFGTGPVKGFALTIAIGILTSMISSIYITRIINEFLLLKLKINKKLFIGINKGSNK